jgi:hypothetical protein
MPISVPGLSIRTRRPRRPAPAGPIGSTASAGFTPLGDPRLSFRESATSRPVPAGPIRPRTAAVHANQRPRLPIASFGAPGPCRPDPIGSSAPPLRATRRPRLPIEIWPPRGPLPPWPRRTGAGLRVPVGDLGRHHRWGPPRRPSATASPPTLTSSRLAPGPAANRQRRTAAMSLGAERRLCSQAPTERPSARDRQRRRP